MKPTIFCLLALLLAWGSASGQRTTAIPLDQYPALARFIESCWMSNSKSTITGEDTTAVFADAMYGLTTFPGRNARQRIHTQLVGWDAVAVLANPAQKIEQQLSTRMVRQLLTNRDQGSAKPTQLYALASENAMLSLVLREHLHVRKPMQHIQLVETASELRTAMNNNPQAVGLVLQSNWSDSGHFLPVDGLAATDGSLYPLSFPVVIASTQFAAHTRHYFSWIESEAAYPIIEAAGLQRTESSATQEQARGLLTVLTITESVQDGTLEFFPHTPYNILSLDGSIVLRVPNALGTTDQQATTLVLPTGRYLIEARHSNRSRLFEVSIAAGMHSTLDLQGETAVLTTTVADPVRFAVR